MSKIRIGIVGVNRGGSHNELWQAHPATQIGGVFDIRTDRARAMADRWKIPQIYTSFDQMLDDDTIDLIYIATPDHLHGQMNIQVLEAGKHLLSEIPLATTVEECQAIVHLAARNNLKVQLGNEVRWSPYLMTVRDLIERGELGEIMYGEGEYLHNLLLDGWSLDEPDGARHWRWDVSYPQTTFLGGGPHAIDTLRWLLGVDQFTTVAAFATSKAIPHTDEPDTAVAIFKDATGVVAKVTVSYGMHRPYCLYFSCYGTEGSFESSRATPQEEGSLFLKSLRGQTGMMKLPVPLWSDPGVKFAGGHGTMEYFQGLDLIEAILEDRDPLISAREGAISCIAAICALEAARTGKSITIPSI